LTRKPEIQKRAANKAHEIIAQLKAEKAECLRLNRQWEVYARKLENLNNIRVDEINQLVAKNDELKARLVVCEKVGEIVQ